MKFTLKVETGKGRYVTLEGEADTFPEVTAAVEEVFGRPVEIAPDAQVRLVLRPSRPEDLIRAIKTLREVINLGLKEAKDIVEAAVAAATKGGAYDFTVREGRKEDLQEVFKTLQSAGLTVAFQSAASRFDRVG